MKSKPTRTTCSSCGAHIVWATVRGEDGQQKRIPLNASHVRAFIWDQPGSDAREDAFTDMGQVRISHFVTCPNAAQHSKKKKKKKKKPESPRDEIAKPRPRRDID